MLHHFEVENFYSIRHRQTIDLRVSGAVADEAHRFAPLWPGSSERVPKVLALFGANASGKTNVLKALAFLAWFIRHSFAAEPNVLLPYLRFLDPEAAAQPTRFCIHFVGPADPDSRGPPFCRYAYELVLGGPAGSSPVVTAESLRCWPPEGGRLVRMFARDASGVVSEGRGFGLSGYRKALVNILRPKASVIATLAQLKHPLATLLWEASGCVSSNILIKRSDDNDGQVAAYYADNATDLSEINALIGRLDLGIRAMRVQSGPNGPNLLFDHAGLSAALHPDFESHGTRQFVALYPRLAQALRSGGIALIDELDAAIHPSILPEIIRWFHDGERNPNNAQLWMTCQNASILEDLVKEEVLFCEKDQSGQTSVYRLTDIQSVRRGDNHYKKYLGGAYGAVPRIG